MEQDSIHPQLNQLTQRKSVTEAYPLQLQLYRGLKTSSVSTMVASQTPTLAKIKREASETDARALIYIAVCEVCDFFNVGKNMNDTQVALTAELILERFWHLRLEEIKFCFRRAMASVKLFDRLDGNIILDWLTAYDNERTEEAMRQSEQKESQELAQSARYSPDDQLVTFEQYMATLREKANCGDEKSKNILDGITESAEKSRYKMSKEQLRQKDLEFMKWKHRIYPKEFPNGK